MPVKLLENLVLYIFYGPTSDQTKRDGKKAILLLLLSGPCRANKAFGDFTKSKKIYSVPIIASSRMTSRVLLVHLPHRILSPPLWQTSLQTRQDLEENTNYNKGFKPAFKSVQRTVLS